MRNILTAAAVLAGSVLMSASGASAAAVITAGACVPGAIGTPCAGVQVGVPGAPPSFGFGSPVGVTVGQFSVSGSAIAGVTNVGATFNTQTITVSSTPGSAGGLLDVYFTISGVTTQQLPLLFNSTFTSNQQNADTHQVIESTYLDNANGIFTHPAAGLLASATLTSAITQTAGPILDNDPRRDRLADGAVSDPVAGLL